MTMEVQALGPGIAAEVKGLRLWEPLTAGEAERLRRLFGEHGVLVFRRQSLSEHEYADFCALFGTLEHTVRTDWASRVRPEIGLITNLKGSNGNPLGGLGDGEVEWHSDQTYMANPATGAALHAVELPAEGGRTYWSNLVAAYEALPERLKQAIDGKNAVFRYQKRLNKYKGADQKLPEEGRKRTPDVLHPLVHVHPISGKKALYLDPTTTIGIVGMAGGRGQCAARRAGGARDPAAVRLHPQLAGRRRAAVEQRFADAPPRAVPVDRSAPDEAGDHSPAGRPAHHSQDLHAGGDGGLMKRIVRCSRRWPSRLRCAAGAQAQTYPDKPIRLVVPFPAGSGTDIIGRLLGQQMSLDLGQPVIVDNRPGASTIVGTDIVAKSAPDGYTMVMASNNHAMNPSLFEGKLPFDSIKDFAAVGEVAVLPFILVVNPKLPAKTLPELIALAKKGGLTYASTGNGTPPHVAGEMLKRAAKRRHHAHPLQGQRGGGAGRGLRPGLDDVRQRAVGHEPGAGGQAARARGRQRQAPRLDAGCCRRSPSLAFRASTSACGWACCMPAGTPADVIDRMSREVEHALADPALRKKIEEQGAEPAYTPPAVFSKFVVDETKRFDELVKEVGLRVD